MSERTVIRAHDRAAPAPTRGMAAYLQEHLGRRLTAVLAGVSDSREVGRWAQGDHAPRHDSELALSGAYQVFAYWRKWSPRTPSGRGSSV